MHEHEPSMPEPVADASLTRTELELIRMCGLAYNLTQEVRHLRDDLKRRHDFTVTALKIAVVFCLAVLTVAVVKMSW